MYALSPSTLSFLMNSIQHSLPDPRNLRRWKADLDAKCGLCGWKNVSHIHILCGCKVALDQGRISFRHDSILKIIKSTIDVKIKEMKTEKVSYPKDTNFEKIKFVKAGTPLRRKKTKKVGLLDMANDWVLNVDLRDKQQAFPPEILVTKDRPDIVMYSREKKIVIILELTSPSEENIEKWRATKMTKYQLLAEHIREAGVYTPHVFTVEVGARGFVSNHSVYVFNSLGVKDRKLVTKMSRCAIRASHFIWINRENKSWVNPVSC